MNNMMSPIALYLRDKGFDVTLFLLNEHSHFLPQADTDEVVDLKVLHLGWTEENFSKITVKEIKKIFKNFDFFIGTDYAAAFCNKANIQLDIYFPAGTDLSEWPFKATKNIIPLRWEYNISLCSKAQFYGIKQAKYLAIDPTNKDYESKIIAIRGNTQHTENIPYHYLPFFENISPLLPELEQFKQQINTFDFKIIQHGRQEWTMDELNDHYKGNERLIYGFKKLIVNTSSNTCLILLEYGKDVLSTKELIAKLNLQNQVIWLPKMLRKYLFQFIKLADIGIGSFGRSWYSSCSIHELMMASIPIVAYRDEIAYKNEDLYPLLNANTADEICSQFEFAMNNRSELAQIGINSYNWLVQKQEKRISNVLNAIIAKEQSNSNIFLKKISNYPYYYWGYQMLKPISWLKEFFEIRFSLKNG